MQAMRTVNMEHSSSTTASLVGSQSSLPGYDSQSNHASQTLSDRERGSRASSVARSDVNSETARYNKVKKPINEAVTSALDEASPQHPIPPEILSQITSQITANVLQQLKVNNIQPPVTAPRTHAMPLDPHDSSSSIANSPPLDRSQVYTPPSPHRETAAPKQISPTQSSFTTGLRHPPSPPSTTRGVSPHGTISQTDDSDSKDEKSCRPKAPQRSSTGGDATILEKCWGKLFEDGQPTQRLGQFLRGIAMHIIEDYEPKHSLVITPDKLQKYYQETKVSKEVFPWTEIFDDRTSSISRMFREFRVEHFLTQDSFGERPDIPALTPHGFATWMTLVFIAEPDLEFERLAYTALHMPISNPDDRKERFPKELSRRMFPQDGDKLLGNRLTRAMRTHCHVKIASRTNSSSESDSRSSNTERSAKLPTPSISMNGHRHSYAEPSSNLKPAKPSSRRASFTGRPPQPTVAQELPNEVAIDDGPEPVLAPQPIERERKPYVAQPGGGKNYDHVDGAPLSKTQSQPPPQSHMLAPQSALDNKSGRSPSVTSNGRAPDSTSKYVPVSVHQQSASSYDPPVQESTSRHRSGSFAGSQTRSMRNRSPSVTRSKDYPRYSENDIKPGAYYPSGAPGYSNSYQWRDPRYDREREHRGSFSDQKDRGREPRPRFQSTSNADNHRYYANDEEYYRQGGPSHSLDPSGYGGYPPNSYRTKQ